MSKTMFRKNPNGHDILVLDREDLERLGVSRRDACLSEIWPHGKKVKPKKEVFYFEMVESNQIAYRPSVIVYPKHDSVIVNVVKACLEQRKCSQ